MLSTDNSIVNQLLNNKNLSNLPDNMIDGKYIPLSGDNDQVIKIINNQCRYCYCIKVMTSDLSNYAFWNYDNLEYEFYGFTVFPMVLKSTQTSKNKPYPFKWNGMTFYSTWTGQVNPYVYIKDFSFAKSSGILIKSEGKIIKVYLHEYNSASKGFLIDSCDILPAIEWLKQSRLFKCDKQIKKIIINLNHNSTYHSHMQDIVNYCRNNMINTSINILH
jgi:hypothetical protein